MACASASELDRRFATGLASGSLLPELQNLRTSMPLFEWLLRLGSNGLLFSGSGERRKRNHVLRSIRRASTHEISPRSKTTTPHPPLCNSRSVDFSACSSRFQGFPLLAPLPTCSGGLTSRTNGKGRGGRKPRRGGSLSRSTCSPAQRATTCICADSVTTVCFPTIE